MDMFFWENVGSHTNRVDGLGQKLLRKLTRFEVSQDFCALILSQPPSTSQ
jgi:hypothetical protein